MATTFYRTEYVDIVGRIPALMYERICWWMQYAKVTDSDGNLWMYRTYQQWAEDLSCSERSARRAKDTLVAVRWIEACRLQASKWKQVMHYRPIRDEHKYWTDRGEQDGQVQTGKKDNSSITKKKDRIKELKKKVDSAKKVLHRKAYEYASKKVKPRGICSACQGSGRLIEEERNTVYGCLCADGRSQKYLKPASEQLYNSLLLQVTHGVGMVEQPTALLGRRSYPGSG